MQAGAKIGPYRIVRQLGAGGMGAVYLGEHQLIGRHAAIKVLLPELSAQRQSVDRFFNEARATSGVSDPGIVQVFDFGFTDEHVAFIVMEFLDGEALSTRLRRLGALPAESALRIARQVAGSLASAHAAGIVHRDLKPDNLYIVRDADSPSGERAKILDFGIAKLSDELTHRLVTRTGQVLGTPVYMSPEQCSGTAAVDHRADIYSLGCVLFQMVAGRPVFDVHGMYAVITAHLKEAPPRLADVAPHVPAAVDAIVQRCLAKAPADRFANMLELQAACDAVLASGGPSLAAMPPAAPVKSEITTVPELMAAAPTPVLTTMGSSAGQPIGASEAAAGASGARRNVGMWAVASAVAIAVGVSVALVTAKCGKDVVIPTGDVRAQASAASAAAASDAGVAAAAVPAAVPVAPATSPPIDAAVPPADAPASPASPPKVVPKSKSAPHNSSSPSSEDLYDDRN